MARELRSGRLIRLWQDELTGEPPFRTDEGALFVAYAADAELKCFRVLGWPMPARILDLHAEFRARTSGMSNQRHGLLDALTFYGLPHITSEQKHDGRAKVMKGPPWSLTERREILEYCQTDVDPMEPLLERMLPRIRASRKGLGQVTLRGRYMAAAAVMELEGIPIDVPTLAAIRTHKDQFKLELVRDVDRATESSRARPSRRACSKQCWFDTRLRGRVPTKGTWRSKRKSSRLCAMRIRGCTR